MDAGETTRIAEPDRAKGASSLLQHVNPSLAVLVSRARFCAGTRSGGPSGLCGVLRARVTRHARGGAWKAKETPVQGRGWLPPGGGPSNSMPNSGASAIHPATSGGIVGSRGSDAGTPTRS